MMRRYAYGWITLGFFLVSLVLHWVFGWLAYANEHPADPKFAEYAIEALRDTFENWQSEFLQLLWQVCGLAWFLYVGSPASREGNERMEHKLDALLRQQGLEYLQQQIDKECHRK